MPAVHTVSSDADADLRARAAPLNIRFAGAAPEAVLKEALALFPGRTAMLSSFGAEAAVSLAILAQVAPDTPVLFLDTGMHFAQTLDYRRALQARLGLTDVRDLATPAAHPRDPKSDLYARDPDGCCALRKVEPLAQAIPAFDLLITGRKRFHGAGRAVLPLFEGIDGVLRLNLLVGLSAQEVEARRAAAGLPRHPLAGAGFASIGCWPCTRAAQNDDADVRAGRWAGTEKTECGIHLPHLRVPA